MTDPPRPDPFPVTRLDSDAGALFVLQSKGKKTSLILNSISDFGLLTDLRLILRRVVARRISSNDGDCWSDDIDITVCVQRIRMVVRVFLFNDDGSRYFLRLLPHV